jgi:tetratricopeptide (TPR) repeat protein
MEFPMRRAEIQLFALLFLVLFPFKALGQSPEGPTFDKALALITQASALIEKGEYAQAIEAAAEATRLAPKFADAYNSLGYAYLKKGEYDQAIVAFNTAIELRPRYPLYLANRGLAYLSQNLYDQALSNLDESVLLLPTYPNAYNVRGMIYQKKGDLERAIAEYDEALRLKPDFTEALRNRGNTLKEQNKQDRANADLAEAERLDGIANLTKEEKDRIVLRGLLTTGTPDGKMRNPDGAIEDANEVLKQKPDYVPALLHRASAYVAKDMLARALEDYDAAIRIDPENPRTYHFRAVAYQITGKFYLALDDLVQSARLQRSNALLVWALVSDKAVVKAANAPMPFAVLKVAGSEAALALGAKYLLEKNYRNAILALDGAIHLSPDLAEAYLYRGAALIAKGDIEKGAADFKEAARLDH